MQGQRAVALSLRVVFSFLTAIAVTSACADDQIDQTFSYTDPSAKTVTVAGEFTNWSEVPLTRGDSGKWAKTLHLKPGYYAYKFVVNGDWVLDPSNPQRKTVNDIG